MFQDDSDDEDSFFPSMPINFVTREPFQAPYQLHNLEHQVILADGLVAKLIHPEQSTDSVSDRNGRLLKLYTTVHQHGTSIATGQYLEVLQSETAQHFFSSIRFSVPTSTAEMQKVQHDSDSWMLRKTEQASVALTAACNIRQNAARYILHGRKSSTNEDEEDEEDEEDDDDWLKDVERRERKCRAATIAMIGAAALNAFVQQNWTGPPIEKGEGNGPRVWLFSSEGDENTDSNKINKKNKNDKDNLDNQDNQDNQKNTDILQQRQDVRLALEIGGDCAFYKCQLPELLLVARCLLTMVASGGSGGSLEDASWNHRNGVTCPPSGLSDAERALLRTSCADVTTARWWAARSAVIHHRTLIFDIDGVIALRNEIETHFNVLRAKYAGAVKESAAANKDGNGKIPIESRRLAAQVELE